jgi:hypothetical protein
MKKPARKKKPTINRRIAVAPKGGIYAYVGLYTRPVQKVVRRWKGKIPGDIIEPCFFAVARIVVAQEQKLQIPLYMAPEWWPFVWEIGTALTEVMTDRTKPAYWLLTLNLSCATNWQWEKWPSLVDTIKKCGGPIFTPEALIKEAERMKILTPPDAARAWLAMTEKLRKMSW